MLTSAPTKAHVGSSRLKMGAASANARPAQIDTVMRPALAAVTVDTW